MDISYLLALQNLRQSLPGPIETFFVMLSYIGDGPALVVLVLVVYWCVNKRAGQFSFFAFGFGNFVNQLLKNIVCAYRPWIRDAAVTPTAAAIEGAGGYSFPSGHTTGTATSLGSFAWLARKSHKWITVVCVIVILLMGFSRNFLGVHTPQDVLVGLLIAIVMIAITQAFMNWIERCDAMLPGHKRDIAIMVAVIIVSALSVALVILKPYPMDYVNGVLLVDPVTMQKGSFEAAGICAGLVIAWVLERRIVGFSTDGIDMRTRVIRLVIGVVIVGITYIGCDVIFKALLPYNWAKLFQLFCVVIMAVFVAPLVFSIAEKRFAAAPRPSPDTNPSSDRQVPSDRQAAPSGRNSESRRSASGQRAPSEQRASSNRSAQSARQASRNRHERR